MFRSLDRMTDDTSVRRRPPICGGHPHRVSGAVLLEYTIVFPFALLILGLGVLSIWTAFRTIAIQYAASVGVRIGTIESQKAMDPYANTKITDSVVAYAARWGIEVAPADVVLCHLNTPGCTGQNIPDGTLFVVRVTGAQSAVDRVFGIVPTAHVLGVNAGPVQAINP
jgi:hypothetical protein